MPIQQNENQQEKLFICRPCGYIMKESELQDVCPACGMPKKVFELYKEKMSPGRNRILNLNLHPITVHFPLAMLVLSLLALILNLIIPNFSPEVLLGAVRYAAVVFPFVVFSALLSGLIDGKLRFKSISTPILKEKIIYSMIMLAASLFTPFLAWNGFDDIKTKLLLLLCGTIAFFCGVVLGHKGKKLMNIGLGGTLRIWGRKI